MKWLVVVYSHFSGQHSVVVYSHFSGHPDFGIQFGACPNPINPTSTRTPSATLSQATAKHEQPLPADIEAAWAEWSRGIGKVDARGMALLRAAFEAGVDVGKRLARDSAESLCSTMFRGDGQAFDHDEIVPLFLAVVGWRVV